MNMDRRTFLGKSLLAAVALVPGAGLVKEWLEKPRLEKVFLPGEYYKLDGVLFQIDKLGIEHLPIYDIGGSFNSQRFQVPLFVPDRPVRDIVWDALTAFRKQWPGREAEGLFIEHETGAIGVAVFNVDELAYRVAQS